MSRLIIVSNRLPLSLRQNGPDVECSPSSGGLVTALDSFLDRERQSRPEFESLWVGWPGAEITEELRPRADALLAERHARAVYLSKEDSDDFYYGFCNETLWPLFHYFHAFVRYDPAYWATYVRINEAFRDAVLAELRPGDTVWVHDYHLLLLPELLRQARPDAHIGFFLHTPFPSHETFRLLPSAWKEQLLRGMLGADLVGFHIHEYTQHFLHCVQRVLGVEHQLGALTVGARSRRADTFSLGVDFEKFNTTAQLPTVAERCAEIRAGVGGLRLILSVDRLDYTKGLAERIFGYERFLERYPEWRGRVTFVLVVVPSRVDVPQYRQMKQELDERVGQINGRLGTLEWTPIVYQFHAVPFEELVALYQAADVALITPLRDGMNLVAKEYLASKPDARGVLILSELAGAAREMNEAILINPHHADEIADAVARALDMPPEEQVARNDAIRQRLQRHDAHGWAVQFLATLGQVKSEQDILATRQLTGASIAQCARQRQSARRALLLLDYDGTLVPIAPRPDLATPDPELIGLLSRLARTPGNAVYVVSGRERTSLERWLGRTGVGIIAEHGVWLREPEGEYRLTAPFTASWKEQVAPLLQRFVSQVAGSALEEKDYAMAWHYRSADPELGAQRAKELALELTQFTANLDLHVLEGKKVVEIRSARVNKGTVAAALALRLEPDFILAIGDDQTDEDVFRALPASAFTVHVGPPPSGAAHCARDPRQVRELLERLTRYEERESSAVRVAG